jgi:hypothetical protein
MIKHFQMMSDEIKSATDPEAKMKEFLTEAMMYQLHMGVNDIKTALINQLNRKFPGEMSEKELNTLSSTLEQQSKELARMLKELEDSAKDSPNMTTNRDGSLSLEQLYRDAEDAKKLIEGMQKMVDRTKRSKTDFEGVMKEIMAELPDDLYEEDIKYDN